MVMLESPILKTEIKLEEVLKTLRGGQMLTFMTKTFLPGSVSMETMSIRIGSW